MTGLLVDTHALLWWLADNDALPPSARELIADPSIEPLVSVASIWEIGIKRGLGKLRAPDDLPQTIWSEGFTQLQIDAEAAWSVAGLPAHHGDPFDRLLISQASSGGYPILTGDPRFSEYDVDVRW